MGIADAFSREDRIEVKVVSFIEMTQRAAKAEVMSEHLMNAVKCEVPYRFIREMMTGIKEGPPEMFTINVDRDAINDAVNSLVGKEESNEEFPE